MCGIAGCIKTKGEIDKARFEKMVDIIEHRGPDDRGVFYENILAMGHRRRMDISHFAMVIDMWLYLMGKFIIT